MQLYCGFLPTRRVAQVIFTVSLPRKLLLFKLSFQNNLHVLYICSLLTVGSINSLLYSVQGGMRDWLYAASWDKPPLRNCAPPPPPPLPPQLQMQLQSQEHAATVHVQSERSTGPSTFRNLSLLLPKLRQRRQLRGVVQTTKRKRNLRMRRSSTQVHSIAVIDLKLFIIPMDSIENWQILLLQGMLILHM